MTASRSDLVRIHYARPPDREEVFVQELLLDAPGVKVTLARNVDFDPAVRVGDRVVLEAGSDAVWFTFPETWHDIGRFHRADGTFTGVYANVITPCDFGEDGRVWHTTDLFLDVWMDPGGRVSLLDEDQLREAVREGWVSPGIAGRAEEEARRLLARAREGTWPPDVVQQWTRERALAER